MGFSALRQHSEKQKHRGLSGVDLFSEGKPKQQALLSQYFVKNLGLLQMNQQKRKQHLQLLTLLDGQ